MDKRKILDAVMTLVSAGTTDQFDRIVVLCTRSGLLTNEHRWLALTAEGKRTLATILVDGQLRRAG